MIKKCEQLNLFLNSIPMLWISGICLLISFLGEYLLPKIDAMGDYTFLTHFAWCSVIISGIPLVYSAIYNILQERRISSALLISIAMGATIYIGDIFATGEIAFIMAIGEFLEDRTVEKAKQGIVMLLNILPSQGRVITETGETMVEAKDIQVGNCIRVLPGESFPADGIIVLGQTTVDQSIITGESLPVDKTLGDEVFTGTLNRFGSVDIQVTQAFANSSLQKMIRLVEEAEEHRAPTQKIVDIWAGWLVPIACIIAVITYCVLAFGLNQPEVALVRAVTVLVVFCPCALALATPTSIVAAIGQATKEGVLIKSGEALERMGRITAMAFDKTGTLTHGKLAVSDVTSFQMDKTRLLSLAMTVEGRSEHPIGKALVAHGREHSISSGELTDFTMEVGKGVFGKVDGTSIYCGNEALLQDNLGLTLSTEEAKVVEDYRSVGKAVIIVANSEKVLGILGLSDQIKKTSKPAIALLHQSGIEKTLLLTGDNEKSANYIASKVGITEIYATLLPQDKVAQIQKMQESKEFVCMVGDGVNDAPALKTASVGIAMGTMGSDIAVEAADIAIMGDDIRKIAYLKKLSLATIFSIKLNITLSMVINFAAIILSVLGLLTPTTGALVHNAGSVLVVLNAARLYDKKILYTTEKDEEKQVSDPKQAQLH